MLFNVILLSYIVIVSGMEKSYTKESFTNDGKPCISDCIDALCVSGFNAKKALCNPGSKPGLQYYTARDKTQNKWCISRCGKFDYNAEDWCYVSHDEWDYCNPEMGTKIVKNKAFTRTKGPCKDECLDRGSRGSIWCHTYWAVWYNSDVNDWEECNTKRFTYMHTKTRQGLDCVGICGAHDGKNYNWCVSTEERERRCAPVARNLTFFNHMSGELRKLEQKDSCLVKVDKHDSLPSGFVSRFVKLLEYPNMGLLTEHLNEDRNPITAYTIMPYAVLNDPTLPIVVRARVTSETILPLDTRNQRKDEGGHIISYILGSTGAVYNIAAPTQRQLLPEWYDAEVLIRDFIVKMNGWAEITVIVVYSQLPTSSLPDGYAVDFALYNYDNTLYLECNDYYYSNNK